MTVRTRALVKRYGPVHALDGLDLSIRKGELYGLIGPNASGKTTFIKVITGLAEASSGTARVLDGAPGAHARRVGYMPQEEALYGDLTVHENLEFFAGLYGAPLRGRERDILNLVELWAQRHRLVEQLSGGTRRRVSLAVALIHTPDVLFLDEPTVGVDPVLRREFWNHFKSLCEDGATLVITTHHLDEARRCDRVGLLSQGKLLREGSPAELMATSGTESLEDAFLHFVHEASA